jgi:hypothetical protein
MLCLYGYVSSDNAQKRKEMAAFKTRSALSCLSCSLARDPDTSQSDTDEGYWSWWQTPCPNCVSTVH